jgi:hypothetical protein
MMDAGRTGVATRDDPPVLPITNEATEGAVIPAANNPSTNLRRDGSTFSATASKISSLAMSRL